MKKKEDHNKEEPGKKFNRRDYLKATGAGTVLFGTGLGSSIASAATNGVPSDRNDWQMTFEDDFEGGSLNTSNWDLGWGWGLGSPGSKTTWAKWKHVNVRNSNLVLTASKEDWESDGVLYAGNIHSKDKVTVEPPVYFEAKCKCIEGVGWQNAFWSKPNSEAWPPEIDVMEMLQKDSTRFSRTRHTLHYSTSGTPGDSSTHTSKGNWKSYSPQNNWPGRSFHVYGVEWQEDVIRHYVDGQIVMETTDPDILRAFNNGGKEYLMLSLNLDNVGTTDKSESWDGKEYLIDWVRVWDYVPGSDSSSGDSTEETKYLWLRSSDGTPVTFEFESSGGNIELDSNSTDVDYWVADDGMTAGGSTDRTGSLPGFWFDGEISSLSYQGPLEMFINDEQVDPESFDGFETTTVIDPLDDLSYYTGDTAGWDLDNTYSVYGDQSAYSAASTAARIYALADDLVTPFERGDRATLTAWFDSGSGLQFGFGHQDDTNRYLVGINSANGNVYLSRVSDAGWETLAFASGVVPTDRPRPIETTVDWDSDATEDGEIAVSFASADGTLFGTISAVTERYDAGGISLTKTGGGRLWVDYLRKTGGSADPTPEPVVAVSTDPVTDVSQSSATLEGSLDVLEGYDAADCYFEWLQYDDMEWTDTEKSATESPSSFTEKLTDLTPGTEYAVRAAASTDEESVTGEIYFFTTEEPELQTDPSVSALRLSDRSNDAWTRVGVDWTVTDPNGNLNYVTVELKHDTGSEIIDATTSSVSGDRAEGSHVLGTRDGFGESYEVTLTVTDTDGTTVSETAVLER